MQIEVFSLCDAATADVGKLNMLGAFDTIFAAKIPVVYPHCAIALRIRFEHDEKGEHQLTLHFIDFDGKPIIPAIKNSINVQFPQEQRTGSINLIFNMQMLKIEKAGEYSIDLAVDGERRASLPLFIRERK